MVCPQPTTTNVMEPVPVMVVRDDDPNLALNGSKEAKKAAKEEKKAAKKAAIEAKKSKNFGLFWICKKMTTK